MSSLLQMLLVALFAHVGKCSNSRSQIIFKTSVLKYLAIFTGKHLCRILFLIKFQDWRVAFLFKKRLQRRCYFCECCRIFKYSFFIEDLSIIPFRNFIWWYIIDISGLYFTAVKLGHVTERTSRQIDQNFLWRDGVF